MVMSEDPRTLLESVVRTGMETFKSTVEGITAVLRTGDSAIRDLDSALTGTGPPPGDASEQAFMNVMALVQGAMQEAREQGSPTAPAVVQRAREILTQVNKSEPSWRPGPSVVRTLNDVFRVALRDLRASNNVLKLAQGQGSIDDLEALTKWADDLSQRLDTTQKIVAQPKPGLQPAAAVANPESAAPEAPAPAPMPIPAPAPKKKTRKKRDTTPKQKGNPQDIAFAKAVAEELGDTKVKQWAEDFAAGKISEKQWVSRLTNHASANYDNLEAVFDRATQRMARESGG